MKKKIKKIIRYSGLAVTADKCRFYFKYLQYYFSNKKFIKTHPEFNFPPAYFLYETYALNYKDYYEDGLCTAREIIDFINPYIDFDNSKKTILDWGCGPGRVVRHLPDLLKNNSRVYGCDFNKSYINWCSKNIIDVVFIKNELKPPVAFAENSFNFIYGISIITHLSEQNNFAWMKELKRILKPGGLLLITSQGSAFKEKLSHEESIKFNSGELVTRTTKTEGHRTFAAFQPKAFMLILLTGFETIKYIAWDSEEAIFGKQDTWLVRKKF